ncbi:MAG TPA: hypothetical protein VM686_25435 [Polyangiaceae bacterium]|nr:hypothetical protein [Polyangiaceae bacterium]
MAVRTGWVVAAAVAVTAAFGVFQLQKPEHALSSKHAAGSASAPTASSGSKQLELQLQVLTKRLTAVRGELVALESLDTVPMLSPAGLAARETLEGNLERLRKNITLNDELHYLQGEGARLSGQGASPEDAQELARLAALSQRATRLGIDSRKHLANAAEVVRQNWGQWKLQGGAVRFSSVVDQQKYDAELERSTALAEQAEQAHAQAAEQVRDAKTAHEAKQP